MALLNEDVILRIPSKTASRLCRAGPIGIEAASLIDRLEGIELRLDDLRAHSNQVEAKAGYLIALFEAHRQQLQIELHRLNSQVQTLSSQLPELSNRIEGLSNRTDNLKERIDNLRSRAEDLSSRTDTLVRRIEDLSNRTDAAGGRIEELSNRMDALGGRIGDLGNRTDEVRDRTQQLAENDGAMLQGAIHVVESIHRIEQMTKDAAQRERI